MHPSCLILYPELHQNTLGNHGTSVPNKPQSQDNEITKESVPIYGESDTDDNPKQIQADACDKPSKMLTRSVKLPKPGQTIKCKFTNGEDQEWRKLNVVSRVRKDTGKNKYLMNIAREGGDLFWLDFEHDVLEWETSIEADQALTDEVQNPTNEASVLVTTSSDEILTKSGIVNSKVGLNIKFTHKY